MLVSASDAVVARVLRGGVMLTVAAVVIQSVAHIANIVVFDYYWDAINADSDTGGPAWASSAVQFAAAVLVLLLAASEPARQLLLAGLAAILAFFSLDDLIMVHERISELANTLDLWDGAGRLVWPVLFFPLLAATFVGLWTIAEAAGGEPRRLIRLGLVLLVGAVVLEIAAQAFFALDVERLDAPFVAEVVLEEGAELGGWGLIVTALAAVVVRPPRDLG